MFFLQNWTAKLLFFIKKCDISNGLATKRLAKYLIEKKTLFLSFWDMFGVIKIENIYTVALEIIQFYLEFTAL
jgi:hypothetical protein